MSAKARDSMAPVSLVVDANGVIRSKSHAEIPSTTLHRWMFEGRSVADPHKPVLIDASRPTELFLSWASYRGLSLRFAAGLMASGFQPGQRVLAVARNSIFCPVAFMGTIMAKGIYCTADPAYDELDLARTVQHLEPSIVLASPELAATVSQGLALADRSCAHLYLFPQGISSPAAGPQQPPSWWSILVSEQEELPDVFAPRAGETDETVAIVYSSGTTGLPKGVQISHRNYIAAALAHMTRLRQGCSAVAGWRVLGSLSMHHVLGQRAYGVVFPLLSVATYVAAVNDYNDVLGLMDKLDIALAILRSSMVTQIGKNPHATRGYKLKHLRRIEACATSLERCMRVAAEEALSRWSPVQVAGVWGLTELGLISGWHLDETCTSTSVGELHANYEARVVQSDGQVALAAGVVGEIQIRAPSATSGYWRNEEASRALFTEDGWVTTGDLGCVDGKGKWYIVDRIKDLIKRNGTYIAPTEIEGIILQHPGVADAAVVGIPIDNDEGPIAFVVLRDEGKWLPAEIEDFVNSKVPHYKRLVGGVLLTPGIPRNTQGKARRLDLKRMALSRLLESRADMSRKGAVVCMKCSEMNAIDDS